MVRPRRERTRRTLLAVVGFVIAAHGGAAEEFWGRELPDQPTTFIFGYGSLINTQSRDATSGRPGVAIPARLGPGSGFLRCWCDRSPSGFTALGLRRPGPGERATTVNGVLYPADVHDMTAFDAREAGYARVEIAREHIQPVSWQRLPDMGRIFVYVPRVTGREPGIDLPAPDGRFPLLQSYIDVVVEGGFEYGPDFAREIIATTADWSPFWLNDRTLPRRPWVAQRNWSAVDDLLARAAPNFADRMFSEEYAAKRLGGR